MCRKIRRVHRLRIRVESFRYISRMVDRDGRRIIEMKFANEICKGNLICSNSTNEKFKIYTRVECVGHYVWNVMLGRLMNRKIKMRSKLSRLLSRTTRVNIGRNEEHLLIQVNKTRKIILGRCDERQKDVSRREEECLSKR